jgi:hypothetical protein
MVRTVRLPFLVWTTDVCLYVSFIEKLFCMLSRRPYVIGQHSTMHDNSGGILAADMIRQRDQIAEP